MDYTTYSNYTDLVPLTKDTLDEILQDWDCSTIEELKEETREYAGPVQFASLNGLAVDGTDYDLGAVLRVEKGEKVTVYSNSGDLYDDEQLIFLVEDKKGKTHLFQAMNEPNCLPSYKEPHNDTCEVYSKETADKIKSQHDVDLLDGYALIHM